MRAALTLACLLVAGCGAQPPTTNAAQNGFAAANAKMHGGMAVIDPDPDIAFAQGMTAHHRGAVEMAEVELRHGRDPELRALAQRIVAAQEPEIMQMQRWLARHRRSTAAPSAAHPAGAVH